MTGLVLHHAPVGGRRWSTPHGEFVASEDALWRLGDDASVWPLPHVTALAASASGVLVLSEGERRRVGQPVRTLTRLGLDATATWRSGWSIPALSVPYGGRWAPDLQPFVRGIGATWTTAGQAFVADAAGVRAVRQLSADWDPYHPHHGDDVATACDGVSVWGPGHRMWDIAAGTSVALPGWVDGVAAARGGRCVVVNAESGEGQWLEGAQTTHTFAIPVRRDAVVHVALDSDGARVTTALGKRFHVHADTVSKLPGRVLVDDNEPVFVERLGIAMDGLAAVAGRQVAWRRDGALVSWPEPLPR